MVTDSERVSMAALGEPNRITGPSETAHPFVAPRSVEAVENCYFYHTMEIPGLGIVAGLWDLRGNEHAYLGGVDLKGKRVLEIGTANGCLCFYMERQGADVVAYDLSEEYDWDVVPFAGKDVERNKADRKSLLRKINDGFWLAHSAFESKAKAARGTLYQLPPGLGDFDIATLGSVLLHVRDPFLGLQKVLELTRHTVVVTDLVPDWMQLVCRPLSISNVRARLPRWQAIPRFLTSRNPQELVFLPDFVKQAPSETWWYLSPRVVTKFLGVLGFEKTELTFHYQNHAGGPLLFYTVVGHRTRTPSYS